MNNIHKKLVLALLFMSGFMVLVSTKLLSRLIIKRPVECSELGIQTLDSSSGDAVCDKRYSLFGKYYTARFLKRSTPAPLKFSIADSWNKYRVTGQSLKPPVGTFIVTDMARENTVWTSSGIGTDWSGATRELVKFPDGTNQYMLNEIQEFTYEMAFSAKNEGELQSTILSFLTIASLCCLLALFVNAPAPALTRYAIVATCLAIVVLWCGMPFGSGAGWFDPGDDTSYMHWTYNLGYLLDPDLTHSPFIKSWSLNHNHHSWGTGLILAPFLLPARLAGSGINLGVLHFGLMNFGAVAVGALAVFTLFKSFTFLSSWRPALAISILILISTSMLKWMFMRNFFSHVPEFLTLACATYFFIQRYWNRRSEGVYFLGLLMSLLFSTQVRRENILFFGLIFLYEALILRPVGKELAKRIVIIGGTAIAAIVILMATNYFTQLKTFFAASQTGQDFHTSNLLQVFLTQGPEVFYRESYGLFYWKNAYPWLALVSCVYYFKSWRWWAPMFGLALVYLLVCTFYNYPNGMEWQNRLLLKLAPILFGGVLVFLDKVAMPAKVVGWAWLILGAILNVSAYWSMIPKGMAFYISDFSDSALMYPQSWPGTAMSIFYLPMIVAWLLSLVLWAIVYSKMRKAHSSNVY